MNLDVIASTRKQMTKPTGETSELSIVKEVQTDAECWCHVDMFFYQEELLLLEFLDHGLRISTAHYCNILHHLCAAIKAKWSGLLHSGVVLLCGIVCSHRWLLLHL